MLDIMIKIIIIMKWIALSKCQQNWNTFYDMDV